jgi:hypothetical protein
LAAGYAYGSVIAVSSGAAAVAGYAKDAGGVESGAFERLFRIWGGV